MYNNSLPDALLISLVLKLNFPFVKALIYDYFILILFKWSASLLQSFKTLLMQVCPELGFLSSFT